MWAPAALAAGGPDPTMPRRLSALAVGAAAAASGASSSAIAKIIVGRAALIGAIIAAQPRVKVVAVILFRSAAEFELGVGRSQRHARETCRVLCFCAIPYRVR